MLHSFTYSTPFQRLFLSYDGTATITYLQRAVYPLLLLPRCALLSVCNADETVWQMCVTAIGLKNPHAKVCHCDESLKIKTAGSRGRDAAGRLVEGVPPLEYTGNMLLSIYEAPRRKRCVYGGGRGSCIFISYVKILCHWGGRKFLMERDCHAQLALDYMLRNTTFEIYLICRSKLCR